MLTHRQCRIESSRVESNQTRKDTADSIWPLIIAASRNAYTPAVPSRVDPCWIHSDSQRRGRVYLATCCRALEYVHTGIAKPSRVECLEFCWVKSPGASCFIVCSRIPVIEHDGCYFTYGNWCRKVTSFKYHQVILDASHCDKTEIPAPHVYWVHHMFRLFRCNLLLHILVCKRSGLEFFTFAPLRVLKTQLICSDVIGLNSVGVHSPSPTVLDSVGGCAP